MLVMLSPPERIEMHKFALMLKTYAGDVVYARRLLASVVTHNMDKLPFYLIAPRGDLALFEGLPGVTEFIPEEDLAVHLVSEPLNGIRAGYINQEVVKLAFWELGRCENYLCLDSDGEFNRDFAIDDFMFDVDTPYTLLAEDNDLAADPVYYHTYWEGRRTSISKIQEAFGLSTRTMITSHGFSIFSVKVLAALRDKYMTPKGLDYRDLLAISPYEFSWYNMWLQKDQTIPLHVREPLFKYLHHKGQHLSLLNQGVTLHDLARGYIGIVVNSNYSRGFGLVGYDASDAYEPNAREVRAAIVSALQTTARGVKGIAPRILRRLRRTGN